jgi:anti-sigma factor RsiW
MITQLTAHDWEAISAYLDEQLNPQERAALEARLQNDLDLQTGLQDLRRTCSLIHRAPRMRAPRNFALTPSMAGSRRGFRFPQPVPIAGALRFLPPCFGADHSGQSGSRFTGQPKLKSESR